MNPSPRVAFLTDSFHEVNGVALTSRQFDAYARRHGLPFLSVHAGKQAGLQQDGDFWTLELQRSRASFNLEAGSELCFDPLLWRTRGRIEGVVQSFRPDVVHVTGPGDFGMLGASIAHRLGIPLAASWHTNVHEYTARRLERLLSFLPASALQSITGVAERESLRGAALFYKIARVLFAPNRELVELLELRTGRPCHLMQRGIDAELYQPSKRDPGVRPFTIGYVGRLSSEKNVRFLAAIEQELLKTGRTDFRFLIAGSGGESDWLRANLKQAEFLGVIKGEVLARAYANMDVFAFPSETDTYGNVILEAQASGVPPVVTTGGGPKYLVKSDVTGLVAVDGQAFIRSIVELMDNPDRRRQMSVAARAHALTYSWDAVFSSVYAQYAESLGLPLAQTSGVEQLQ